jgi:hypothetical protein
LKALISPLIIAIRVEAFEECPSKLDADVVLSHSSCPSFWKRASMTKLSGCAAGHRDISPTLNLNLHDLFCCSTEKIANIIDRLRSLVQSQLSYDMPSFVLAQQDGSN